MAELEPWSSPFESFSKEKKLTKKKNVKQVQCDKSASLCTVEDEASVVGVSHSEVGDHVDDALDGFQMLLPRRGSNVVAESWFGCGCTG